MAELWDAYSRDFKLINDTSLVRGEPIPEGMYHLVSEVIVRHKDGDYLLMQRDTRKTHGGQWELTAGGSVLKGETALEGAYRELFEETGIKASALNEVAKLIRDSNLTLYTDYICITDCDKDSIVLQEGETINYRWVSREELLNLTEDYLISKRAVGLVRSLDL